MDEDPARYLAGRFAVLYAGEAASPAEDVTRACRERGIEVYVRPRLGARGYFVSWPAPAIILGARASLRAQRHEFLHAWLNDAVEHGIEYDLPAWEWNGDEEAAADRFAAYLAEAGET